MHACTHIKYSNFGDIFGMFRSTPGEHMKPSERRGCTLDKSSVAGRVPPLGEVYRFGLASRKGWVGTLSATKLDLCVIWKESEIATRNRSKLPEINACMLGRKTQSVLVLPDPYAL